VRNASPSELVRGSDDIPLGLGGKASAGGADVKKIVNLMSGDSSKVS